MSCARAALDVWELTARIGRQGSEAEDAVLGGSEESITLFVVDVINPWRARACGRRFGAWGRLRSPPVGGERGYRSGDEGTGVEAKAEQRDGRRPAKGGRGNF